MPSDFDLYSDPSAEGEEGFEGPSKSERKRQMHALQALGERLVNLSQKQLAQLAIDDEPLLQAVIECQSIRSHSARKRMLQRIGKLMRNVDPEPIAKALDDMHHAHQQATDHFHELEALRDAMLAAGPSGVELAIARFPEAPRQPLRQLLLQHQRETAQDKPPAASRKLFRLLRELQEHTGAED